MMALFVVGCVVAYLTIGIISVGIVAKVDNRVFDWGDEDDLWTVAMIMMFWPAAAPVAVIAGVGKLAFLFAAVCSGEKKRKEAQLHEVERV